MSTTDTPVFAVLAGRPEPAELAAVVALLVAVAGEPAAAPAPPAATWRCPSFAGPRSWRGGRSWRYGHSWRDTC